MSDPLQALFTALSSRLKNANPLWEDRVSPEYIRGTYARPSIVFHWAGGGDTNRIAKRAPVFVIDVQMIAEISREAMAGARFISDLVRNQGSQDTDENGDATERAISGDEEWLITTITQGLRIHVVDNWGTNAKAVYHSGHEFTITMEAL